MNGLFNDANKYLSGVMDDTFAILKGYQDAPLGKRKRTTREQHGIWKRLQNLDDDLREYVLDSMAESAGHQNDEQEPCEVCEFILQNVGR